MTRQQFTVNIVYGHGHDADELARLAELGFDPRPEPLPHPGPQIRRSLMFARGLALELIEVLDDGAYRAVGHPACRQLAGRLVARDARPRHTRTRLRSLRPVPTAGQRLHPPDLRDAARARHVRVLQRTPRPKAAGAAGTHHNGITGVTVLIFD
jgi:hypothetical protein